MPNKMDLQRLIADNRRQSYNNYYLDIMKIMETSCL